MKIEPILYFVFIDTSLCQVIERESMVCAPQFPFQAYIKLLKLWYTRKLYRRHIDIYLNMKHALVLNDRCKLCDMI